MSRENLKLFWQLYLHVYLYGWAWQMAPLGSLSSVGFSREGVRPVKYTVHMTVIENLLVSVHMVCIF